MSRAWTLISGMVLGALIFAGGAACGFWAAGCFGEDASGERVAEAQAPLPVLAVKAEKYPSFPEEILHFTVPRSLERGDDFGAIVPRASFAPLPLVEVPDDE